MRLLKTVSCHRSYTMARLSAAKRHKLVRPQEIISKTEISNQTGVSRCAVQFLLKKHKERGNVEDCSHSGRTRKLSAADEKQIKLILLQNRNMSTSAISPQLVETCATQVHPSTFWRSLARSCLHGGVAAKSHTSDMETKAKWLNYAWKHRHWGAGKSIMQY